jgi:isopenicillin-N N-acyltransferase-like protein
MPIPVLTLRGDARERGLAHGRTLGPRIHANIAAYLALFATGGVSRQALRDAGEAWSQWIAANEPDYHAEMAAVAEGAGADPAFIAMLNARYEFAYTQTSTGAALLGSAGDGSDPACPAAVDGCTAIGVEAEATRDGHVLLAQSWDWHADMAGGAAVLRIEAADRPRSLAFTEAGVVGGKIGFNECGIGLLVNGLCTTEDGKGERRLPFHLRCARILAADRFDEALRPILDTSHLTSANYLVGQAGGEMIDVEVAPGGYHAFYPEAGILTHANHFESFQAASLLERLGPHSLFRARRLRRLVSAASPDVTVATLQEGLSDHYSFPASICRHVDPRRGERRLMTLAALVLDLDAKRMHVTDGPPCSTPWQSISLDEAG